MARWTVTLKGYAADLLERLTRARDSQGADVLGRTSYRQDVLAEACALGLAELGRRAGLPPVWRRRCVECDLTMVVDRAPDKSSLDFLPDCPRCGTPHEEPWVCEVAPGTTRLTVDVDEKQYDALRFLARRLAIQSNGKAVDPELNTPQFALEFLVDRLFLASTTHTASADRCALQAFVGDEVDLG